jgi:beta-xylosidase
MSARIIGGRRRTLLWIIAAPAVCFTLWGATDAPPVWGQWPAWGDQGDGTYRNPVLPADYSDIDCIRVGADFYAISSTFQFSPGVVILHSKDLVNWRTAGHAVADVTQISPEMNWDRMNRYGRGVWAGAIRHHAGRFRVYFGTPDEGYFMTSAPDVAGPWEPLHRVLDEAGWDDCCPFWDDDGQGWFVGTSFRDGYKTWLFKLTPDGRDIVREGAVLINEGSRREANKLYKIDGIYYHFFSEWKEGVGRYVMMQRAGSITGPYTEVRQLSHVQRDAMEPNQGGLVQTDSGEWHFFTHHGTGQWEGRAASLLPVTWIDGWPVIGAPGRDGIGTMVWSARKPVEGAAAAFPQGSDEFADDALAPQWEWNHQPRAGKWSLTERSGFLRLHAFQGLDGSNLLKVGNVLTQRAVRTTGCEVVVRMEIAGMADGQRAGLCHFSAARRRETPAAHSASLGAVQRDGRRWLEFSRDGVFTTGPELSGSALWLRSAWGLDGVSRFAFSTDGETFTPFGDDHPLVWGSYRGDRIGLFSFNETGEAGFVDVDWVCYGLGVPRLSRATAGTQ